MRFSKLSEAEAQEMLAAASDPAYREMNRVEAELAATRTPATEKERLERLAAWRTFLARLVPRDPDRRVQEIESFLL